MQPRLLERIQQRGTTTARSADAKQALSRSIVRNSHDILSTREKSVLIHQDMGMPELHELGAMNKDQLFYVAQYILQQLNRFEKRLLNVRVSCQPNGSANKVAMLMDIEGTFEFGNEQQPIKIEFEYYNDGKLMIRT